ncbi:MAG: MoaD/ThiS family protein [Spirochaetales bacterium]|jgi:MoaD family protein|nr:MoaD/ThiS family protein [Spirochaetales bacterium]
MSAMEVADILGGREKEILLPEGSDVSEFLLELEKRYGEPITKALCGPKRRQEQILLLNGRNIYFLEGLQTELKDGDQIFIRPAAAGG